MRLGSFGYLAKQGWRNMAANRLMTFASIGVLTACLILTGIAALVSVNVNRIVEYFGNKNEIVAFVLPEVTDEQSAGMKAQIDSIPYVFECKYISKEEAYAEMVEMMAQYSNLLEGYPDIFPASFRVTVEDLSYMEQLTQELNALPGIEYASTRFDLAEVMMTVKDVANYSGIALVVVLGLVSTIVISNTIRLTVFARRREISIMKYVGATNAFIRLPFFVEGLTVGLVSGLFASGVVCGVYYFVLDYLKEGFGSWQVGVIQQLLPFNSVWYWVVLGFVAFGAVIGGMGTISSIRKHLKV